MKLLEHPALKAVDVVMVATFLFAFIYFASGASNVTVNSSVSSNQFFDVGAGCVIDNASNNKYCFVKKPVAVGLACPSFGVAPQFNYSDSELGVFVQFNSSLCNPVIINNTVYPDPVFAIQEKPMPLNVHLKLGFGECFIEPQANASICAPDGKINLFVLLKKGEIYNDSERGFLVLVDNESFKATPEPVATPAPVDEGVPGVNQQQQPNNAPPLAAPAVQDNLLGALAVVALIVGGVWYVTNRQNKQEGAI